MRSAPGTNQIEQEAKSERRTWGHGGLEFRGYGQGWVGIIGGRMLRASGREGTVLG